MGKDFIPLKINGYNLLNAYKFIQRRIISGSASISEADNLENFKALPSFLDIEEIEVGSDGTDQTILRLKNNGFCVVDNITYEKIKKVL